MSTAAITNLLRKLSSIGSGQVRDRSIVLSLMTSSGAKVVGIASQLVAYPIVVHALGLSTFSSYLMLASLLDWMALSRLGIGPALLRAIVAARVAGRRSDEADAFVTALSIALCMAVLLLTVAGLVLGFGVVSPERLLATKSVGQDEIAALTLSGVLIAAGVVTSVTEGARAGYLEQYVNNLWDTVGGVVSLSAMLAVAAWYPTLTGMCLAVFGSLAAAKAANMVELVALRRRYLAPRLRHFRGQMASRLVNSSAAFFIVQVCNLLLLSAPTLLIGWSISPSAATPFNVVYRLEALLTAGLSMITVPLWPALTDALERKDRPWIKRVHRRLIPFTLLYSSVIGLTIALFGRKIIALWVGSGIGIDMRLQITLGLYYPIWLTSQALYTFLIGLGRTWQAAGLMSLWATIVMLFWFATSRSSGSDGMAMALCAGGLTCLPLFSLFTDRAIRNA